MNKKSPKPTHAIGWQAAMALMINILSLAMPIMMLQVYDRIIPHQSYGTLLFLVTGVLIALACDAGLRIMRAYLAGFMAAAEECRTGHRAISRILGAELNIFEKSTPGIHLQNISAIAKLRDFYSGQAMLALIDLPFACLFLGLIAYLAPVLVIVPIAMLGVFVLAAMLAGNKLKRALEHRQDSDENKASFMVSVLSGIHSVKALSMEASLARRFDTTQAHATRDSYKVAMASGGTTTLGAVFGQLSLILTATAGCILVMNNMLTVGGLTACTILSGRAIQPIQRVLGAWLRLQDLAIAKKQAHELFSLPQEQRRYVASAVPQGQMTIQNLRYGPQEGTILLNNIDLEVAPGEVIAITGDKGSGKSTLLQLIAGSLVPQSGKILIDEQDTAQRKMTGPARYVGYMPQQGTIFQGSIIDNISGFSNDDTVLSRAKITAQLLGIDEAVNVLPRGYQTVLNDNEGDPVPPGLKQRIALARVLMHQPGVLLFDDADRALDKEGYNRLFRLLGKLKGNCTMIIVSHDQNLMSLADRSYRLEGGTLKAGALNTMNNNITIMPKTGRETLYG